jgi:hypothetical protein
MAEVISNASNPLSPRDLLQHKLVMSDHSLRGLANTNSPLLHSFSREDGPPETSNSANDVLKRTMTGSSVDSPSSASSDVLPKLPEAGEAAVVVHAALSPKLGTSTEGGGDLSSTDNAERYQLTQSALSSPEDAANAGTKADNKVPLVRSKENRTGGKKAGQTGEKGLGEEEDESSPLVSTDQPDDRTIPL